MTSDDALLPCAHCGGDAHIGTVRYSKPLDNTWWNDDAMPNGRAPITEAFFAHCARCAIGQRNSPAGGYRTEAEAIAAWNRRAGRAGHAAGQSEADARVKVLEAENARLREAIAVAAVWTAVPGTTIAEIRAALEGRQP